MEMVKHRFKKFYQFEQDNDFWIKNTSNLKKCSKFSTKT